jgi:hypothetical protein
MDKRTTIQLYEGTKKDLTKLIADLEQDGRKRSYDEGLTELIQFWIKGHSDTRAMTH